MHKRLCTSCLLVLVVLGVWWTLPPQLVCDSTALDGPLILVVSDLHVHPYMPFLNFKMRQVVQSVHNSWPGMVKQTIMLGDAMHWAGGLANHLMNLSDTQWDTSVKNVKWILDDADAIYVPGNHDLNDSTTLRWNTAFGSYDRDIQLFGNVTARLASSMAPKRHNATVLLSHYPVTSARDPLWHSNLSLSLNGHKHLLELRKFRNTRQITLPTLNPYQAISNHNFKGDGQQGFALMDASLRVRLCCVGACSQYM